MSFDPRRVSGPRLRPEAVRRLLGQSPHDTPESCSGHTRKPPRRSSREGGRRTATPPREEHPGNEHARLHQQLTPIDRFANLSHAARYVILDKSHQVNPTANWSLYWKKNTACNG